MQIFEFQKKLSWNGGLARKYMSYPIFKENKCPTLF